MVKIYVLELSCLIEIIKGEHLSEKERAISIKKSHQILEEIPIIVKNRQQHQLTIIELMVKFKEVRAYAKLREIDFISYKLFKLERAINFDVLNKVDNSMYLRDDEDDKMSPEDNRKG